MPPTLLALDTATEICSVALAVAGRIVEAAEAVGPRHSDRILPMVHELLQANGLQLVDCDAIGFGAGPGAFTGLRVTCGIAQGLAFGAGRPVVPVGNLAALALAAQDTTPEARRILVAIDARMQQVYWALYEDAASAEVVPPALASAEDLAALCRRHGADLVAGNALLAYPEQAARIDMPLAAALRGSAATIARQALRRLGEGDVLPPEQAAPIYVRDRVAQTIEERRAAAAVRR